MNIKTLIGTSVLLNLFFFDSFLLVLVIKSNILFRIKSIKDKHVDYSDIPEYGPHKRNVSYYWQHQAHCGE